MLKRPNVFNKKNWLFIYCLTLVWYTTMAVSVHGSLECSDDDIHVEFYVCLIFTNNNCITIITHKKKFTAIEKKFGSYFFVKSDLIGTKLLSRDP